MDDDVQCVITAISEELIGYIGQFFDEKPDFRCRDAESMGYEILNNVKRYLNGNYNI